MPEILNKNDIKIHSRQGHIYREYTASIDILIDIFVPLELVIGEDSTPLFKSHPPGSPPATCCSSTTRSTVPLTLHDIYFIIIQINTRASVHRGYGTGKKNFLMLILISKCTCRLPAGINLCALSFRLSPACPRRPPFPRLKWLRRLKIQIVALPKFAGQPLPCEMFPMFGTITVV